MSEGEKTIVLMPGEFLVDRNLSPGEYDVISVHKPGNLNAATGYKAEVYPDGSTGQRVQFYIDGKTGKTVQADQNED